ncbi:MAG: hypothetical protein ACI9UK_000912 [Candidatus Krumholzibacteriia bacterium]|jgi:hypothetical protein
MIAMTDVYRPDEKCPVRALDGGMVVMAPGGNQAHTLDELGTFIWQQLNGERDLDEIVKNICKEYEVSQDVAEGDLQEFVTEMAAAQIIQLTS